MASFLVTNVEDSGPGSLRGALALANAGRDSDQIDFAPELAGGTVASTSGELVIAGPVSIDADLNDDGVPDITLDAQGNSRVLAGADRNRRLGDR